MVKSTNARAAHKGLVFTGGGVVYAAVIMVAAVVLDNLDFVGFAALSPVIGTSILIAVLGFYDDFTDITAFHKVYYPYFFDFNAGLLILFDRFRI